MKRIVSILLIVCMLFASSTMLFSCGDCVFSEDWTKNSNYHWRACTDEDCTEITDKAEHVWDEGQITKKATQEAAGVKTFTCTTCAQTKNEAIEFTGLTEEDWNIALSEFTFENVTYEESAVSSKGIESGAIKYKFNEDLVWIKDRVGVASTRRLTDKKEIKAFRRELVDSLQEIARYESYQYDAATKTYQSTEPIYISSLKASSKNITLTFENGKLAEVKYVVKIYAVGDDYTVTVTAKLWDYGTSVVDGF